MYDINIRVNKTQILTFHEQRKRLKGHPSMHQLL